MPSTAVGQDAQSRQDGEGLGEIVVTATRRAEGVADIPYNIQALSSDQLEKTGATELADYIRTVPGASFIDRGPGMGMDIVLRGLRTGPIANQRTTSIYIDDTEIPTRFDPRIVDIERVEILRGPQGTLYGSGAIGGAIRYISRKPNANRFEGALTGELGSVSHGGSDTGISGMVNIPIVQDRVAARANLGYFDSTGFLDNARLGRNDVNSNKSVQGRVSFLARPLDDLELALTYYRQETDTGFFNTVDEDVARYSNNDFLPSRYDRDQDIANLTVAYDFGSSRLTSSSSYRRLKGTVVQDLTVFVRDIIYASFLPPDLVPDITSYSTIRQDEDYWTQELRLVSDNEGPLSYIAGVYYENSHKDAIAQERIPIPFPGQAGFEQDVVGAPLNDDKSYFYPSIDRFEQEAVFGEIGYRLTDRWQASIGGRYFRYTSSADFYAIDQTFNRNPDGTARTVPFTDEFSVGKVHETGSILRLNGSYDLGKDRLAYLTVSEGYRPGGYNLVGANTGISPSQFAYKPDEVVNYEAGLKGYALGRRLYVSGALYYIDWSDIQTNVRTSTGFTVAGNAGAAHSTGAELEIGTQDLFVKGFSLALGYAFTSTRLDETVAGLGYDGDRAPYVPRHSGSVTADYALPVAGGIEVGFNLSATYTGNSATEFGAFTPDLDGVRFANDQYLDLDAYWLIGVSARVSTGPWSARLGIVNLTNEYADIYRSFQPASSPYRSPYVNRTVNEPRSVTLSLTRKF